MISNIEHNQWGSSCVCSCWCWFDWVFVICLFVCLTFDLVWTEYAVIRHRMVSESLGWPHPYPFYCWHLLRVLWLIEGVWWDYRCFLFMSYGRSKHARFDWFLEFLLIIFCVWYIRLLVGVENILWCVWYESMNWTESDTTNNVCWLLLFHVLSLEWGNGWMADLVTV